MRVVRDRVSAVTVFMIAAIFLLCGGALGRCARKPSLADHILVKRVDLVEDRLHKLESSMADVKP